MSDYPTREEWAPSAEAAVRQQCYSTQRVSEKVADIVRPVQVQQLSHLAKNARREFHRITRMLGDPSTVVSDVELHWVHLFLRNWSDVTTRFIEAGKRAEDEAVAREIARRSTNEAWEKELSHRAMIDSEWVTTTEETL